MAMREIPIREALNEAIAEEMELDEKIFLMGEEVGFYNGAYKVSRGLLDRFGEKRIIDTPIAENGFAGVGIGAAMAGLRPIIEFMTWNFSLIAIDQVINSAAKMRYMSGGQFTVPMVFRGPGGAVTQLASQHSHSLESCYTHCPGLLVVAPSNSYDAKGLLKSAIRENNPVIFIESEAMYGVKGEVPEETYTIPLGVADVKRSGDSVTILCWGKAVPTSLEAAGALAEQGVAAEVIDLRTLRPLDRETIRNSILKTNRAVVVEEAWPIASYGSWLASDLTQELFDYLDAPILTLSGRDCPYPYAKNLEKLMRPQVENVIETVKRVL
jgi:pyruvate dehydrogenase E1 component beta subunit